jgi:hypothetical protein
MKTIKNNWLGLCGMFVTGIAAVGIVFSVVAQTVPPPVLTIIPTGSNQFLITVTNGVAYGNYTLYSRLVLNDPTFPWTFLTNPVPGVTNFTVSMGADFQNFYQVTGSTNWNNNGIPNWDYADPKNPGLGVLTVTIVSPAQGAIIQ